VRSKQGGFQLNELIKRAIVMATQKVGSLWIADGNKRGAIVPNIQQRMRLMS